MVRRGTVLHRVTLTAALSLSVCFPIGSECAAESWKKELSAEERARAAQVLGFDPNIDLKRYFQSRFTQETHSRLIKKKLAERFGVSEEEVANSKYPNHLSPFIEGSASVNAPFLSTAPIYKHLKGSNGVTLTKIEPIELDVERIRGRVNEIAARVQQQNGGERDWIRSHRANFQEIITPKVLRACESSRTERVRNDKGRLHSDKKGELLEDILFVRPAVLRMPEIDIYEVFGEQVSVLPYLTEAGYQASLHAVKQGADCLPFRIRATKKYIYRHWGRDALQLFGKNPDKKGKLHPLVKASEQRFLR